MDEIRGPEERPLQPAWPLQLDQNNGPFLPITKTIQTLRQDFLHLLYTNPGEWPFDPDIGVGIEKYIFSNYPELNEAELASSVTNQLQKFLPSIKLIDLKILSSPNDQDKNFANIKIKYVMTNLGSNQLIQELELDIPLLLQPLGPEELGDAIITS